MPRKTIRQYYLLSFLSSALGMQIISAIYATYLQKHGLNLFEVNLVNAIYFTTLFVFEIPTGAFADIFGRKHSFVISTAVMSVSMLVYGLADTFWGFVCAEVIAAFGMTFKTGAFQAWLVDSLRHQGFYRPLHRIFGRSAFYNQVGGSVGAITGAYAGSYYDSLPWLMGSAGMFLVTLLAFFSMKEDYFVQKSYSWSSGLEAMRETARTSFRYAKKDRAVRFILVATFVQIYSVQALNMYWQPFFRNHSIKEEHLGFIYAGMMFFIAIGSFLAGRLKGSGKEKAAIYWSMLYVGVTVLLATASPFLSLSVSLFLVHELGRGFWGPMAESYLHHRVPSEERATIVSFCAIAPHVGGAIGLLASGAIAELCGIGTAWAVAGSALLLGAILVRRTGQAHSNPNDLH